MPYEFKIGTTEGGMVDIYTLANAAPHAGYRPYSQVLRTAAGTQKGVGFPLVTWHWDVITVAERDELIGDLGDDLSAARFIRTRLPDNTFATFECIMHRPTGEEDLQAGRILDFDIEFTHCILIPDSP
jgi:hypothetical protein